MSRKSRYFVEISHISFLFVLLRGVYNFFQSIYFSAQNDHLVSLPHLCALLIQTNILASVTLKPQTRSCRVGAEPASVTLCSLSPFDLFAPSGLGAAQCVNSSIRLTPTRSDPHTPSCFPPPAGFLTLLDIFQIHIFKVTKFFLRLFYSC